MLPVIIMSVVAWYALPHTTRLAVAMVAIVYGVMLGLRRHRIERVILAFASTTDISLSAFDHMPTRAQRRAMRASLRLAVRQTEFMSLFPNIAMFTQRLVRSRVS